MSVPCFREGLGRSYDSSGTIYGSGPGDRRKDCDFSSTVTVRADTLLWTAPLLVFERHSAVKNVGGTGCWVQQGCPWAKTSMLHVHGQVDGSPPRGQYGLKTVIVRGGVQHCSKPREFSRTSRLATPNDVLHCLISPQGLLRTRIVQGEDMLCKLRTAPSSPCPVPETNYEGGYRDAGRSTYSSIRLEGERAN